jgi:hypothetical protein
MTLTTTVFDRYSGMKTIILFFTVAIVTIEVAGQQLTDGRSFSIGAQYNHEFLLDGFVQVREWELPGDKMKLKDLGMKSYPALQLKVEKRLKRNGNISIVYDHFFMSGKSTFDRNIIYNGTIINGRNGIDVSPTRYFRISAIYSAELFKRPNFSLLYTAGLVFDHITFYLDGQVDPSSKKDEVLEGFGRQAFPYPVIGLKGTAGINSKECIQWMISGSYVPKFKSFYIEGGHVYLRYSNFETGVSYSRAISNFDISIGAKLRYMHLFQESNEDTNVINTLTMGPYIGLLYHF